MATIKESLSLPLDTKTFYWIDSSTALYWIKNVKELEAVCRASSPRNTSIVGQGAVEILSGVAKSSGYTIPWLERGAACNKHSVVEWSRILLSIRTIVARTSNKYNSSRSSNEGNCKESSAHYAFAHAHQNPVTRLDKIIDFKSHSTLSWLLRVTAYTNILYTKRREKRAKNSLAEALTATEINRAESMWLRTVQMSSFKSELDFIKNRRDCCPTTHVSHFGLFLDDQHILQCKGRVKKAAITESSKNPVWLPSRHHFCRLRSHNPRCAQENRTLGYSPDIGYSARTILGVTRWGSRVKKFEEVRHL